MADDPPGVTVPAADPTLPPLRVALAVGNPEHERRLYAALTAAGLVIAERCLDAAALVELDRAGVDVALVGSGLHRLTTATLLAVRDRGLPLVLLADADQRPRYEDLADVALPATPIADLIIQLQQTAGRGSRRAGPARPSPAPGRATGRGGSHPPRAESAGRVIALTGGKGAPGVTTIAAALADALAMRGRAVLLVDADLRLGGIGAQLDLDPRRGLVTLMHGPRGERPDWRRRLGEEVQHGPGFMVLAGIERGSQRGQVTTEVISAALDGAVRDYTDVVVDVGAVIDGWTPPGAVAALQRAEQVLLVAIPDLPGIWQARAALDALRDTLGLAVDRVGLVLNRCSRRAAYPATELAQAFGRPVLAEIPDDGVSAARALEALVPLSRMRRRGAAGALHRLAGALDQAQGAERRTVPERRPRRRGAFSWRRA